MNKQKLELSCNFLFEDNIQDLLWDFGPEYILACLWAKAILIKSGTELNSKDVERIAYNCKVEPMLLDVALGCCDFFDGDGYYFWLKDNRAEEIESLKALPYNEYLKSDYWRKISYSVKRDAGFKCVKCGSSKRLEVHHLSYEHKGDEMNHLEDLVCLCHECHSKEHENK